MLSGLTDWSESPVLEHCNWQGIPGIRYRKTEQGFAKNWTIPGWRMSSIPAALALPEESRERVVYKLGNIQDPQSRFPAFFGPGHDWIPDHNWGGSGMVGLQEMLLAAEPGVNGKLHLFPSWPNDWDVDFKLHGTRTDSYRMYISKQENRKKLTVTPKSREKDIVNWLNRGQRRMKKQLKQSIFL